MFVSIAAPRVESCACGLRCVTFAFAHKAGLRGERRLCIACISEGRGMILVGTMEFEKKRRVWKAA